MGQFLVLVLGTTGFYRNVNVFAKWYIHPDCYLFGRSEWWPRKINRDLSALARLMPERAIACCKWRSCQAFFVIIVWLPRSTFAGQSICWAGEQKSRFTSAVITSNTVSLRSWLVLCNYVCFCQYTANLFLLLSVAYFRMISFWFYNWLKL